MAIALNLQIEFDNTAITMILILPIHEHGKSFKWMDLSNKILNVREGGVAEDLTPIYKSEKVNKTEHRM